MYRRMLLGEKKLLIQGRFNHFKLQLLKMKLVLVCIWLISETYALPTQTSTVDDSKRTCCAPEPQVDAENNVYKATFYGTEKPNLHHQPYDMESFNGNDTVNLVDTEVETATTSSVDFLNTTQENTDTTKKHIGDLKPKDYFGKGDYSQSHSGLTFSDILKQYGLLPESNAITPTIEPYYGDENITNRRDELEEYYPTEGSAFADTPNYNESYGVTAIPPVTVEKSTDNQKARGRIDTMTKNTKNKKKELDSAESSSIEKTKVSRKKHASGHRKKNGKHRDVSQSSNSRQTSENTSESDSESGQRFD
ncbi:uncharacterized protein LOC134615572 isoform X2 [Pelobates fuscus]|uniref:uncharacterized protein LOC134615572 isoform X2 n=1 Tax=Pelobates fuscus TaxID=191477 RepID=UPI002FE455FA